MKKNKIIFLLAASIFLLIAGSSKVYAVTQVPASGIACATNSGRTCGQVIKGSGNLEGVRQRALALKQEKAVQLNTVKQGEQTEPTVTVDDQYPVYCDGSGIGPGPHQENCPALQQGATTPDASNVPANSYGNNGMHAGNGNHMGGGMHNQNSGMHNGQGHRGGHR